MTAEQTRLPTGERLLTGGADNLHRKHLRQKLRSSICPSSSPPPPLSDYHRRFRRAADRSAGRAMAPGGREDDHSRLSTCRQGRWRRDKDQARGRGTSFFSLFVFLPPLRAPPIRQRWSRWRWRNRYRALYTAD